MFSRTAGNHGQAAVEMLSYGSFFLLAFVATVAVFFYMQAQEIARAEHSYAQEIAYQFADQISVAFISGPGFTQNVSLPPNILGKPYKITLSRTTGAAIYPETGFVYVEWQGPTQKSVLSVPTISTAYDLSAAGGNVGYDNQSFIEINSTAGKVNMENRNGTIRFKKG